MKRVRTEEEEEADAILETSPTPLYRKPDAQIQREWRHTIESTLVNFIQHSPLKTISENLSPDFYGNMSPFLVKEVLRMATPTCGVHVALQSIIETMQAICIESVHRLLDQSAEIKSKHSITLLCETLPMPAFLAEQIKEDESLKNKLTLQEQHILENDRHKNWLDVYAKANAKTINVFTVKIGPGVEKATPLTGRYIVSLLMPMTAPVYHLRPAHEPHINIYEELDATYRRTLIELDAHKSLAVYDKINSGVSSNNKKTLYEEAVELAKKIQDKRVIELRRQNDQQCMHIRQLTSDLQEISTLLDSKEQQDVAAMRDTVLMLVEKLKQSRRRNYDLVNYIHQKAQDNNTATPNKMRFQQRKAKSVSQPRQKKQRISSSASDGSYDGEEDSFTKSTADECSYSTTSHKENDDSI